MGIKFLCPNGHKLNVKGFLAGKKAICPKCGARVIVPDVEDTGSSGTALGVVAGGDSTPSAMAVDTLPPSSAATAFGQPQQAVVDPIAEAPGAVWYVRPATGGQYGPASGDIMRGWIREGRVGASSLVWRAGWDDWRPAESTFAELAVVPGAVSRLQPANGSVAAALPEGRVVESLPPVPAAATAAADASAAALPVSKAAFKRKRKNEVNMIASGVLAVVTLILLIVLAFVWRAQHAEVEPTAPEAPAAKSPGI